MLLRTHMVVSRRLRRTRVMSTSSTSTRDEKNKIVQAFLKQVEQDHTFMKRVLDAAPTKQVKTSIVRPIASHVGKILDKEFARADVDGNQQLSALELRNWYKMKYPSFGLEAGLGTGAREVVGEAAAGGVQEPSRKQLRQLAVMAGIPFIGFGFLDNAIMLVAGNQIEASMGVAFGITPLMAAGLGNMVSDVAGLKAGGAIEIMAAKLGLPDPGLTTGQLKLGSVKRTTLLAGALGLSIGCLLGMFPLLFIDEHENMLREIFQDIDTDHSGSISQDELEVALAKLGMQKSEVEKIMSITDVNADDQISFEEFKKMAKIVRTGNH